MNDLDRSPSADRIVVGVDGSSEGKRALGWAAAEAKLRGATLVLAHVWGIPHGVLAAEAQGLHDRSVLDEFRREAQDLVTRERAELGDMATGLEIEEAVLEGAPAQGLLEASQDADLLVLGSRGGTLGSVGEHCVRHAVCPVVVVPSATRGGRRSPPPQAPWQSRGRTSA